MFPKEEWDDINFLINIETITGFNNLEDIVKSEEFKDIDGITLGRVDMTGSMGLSREDINCDTIFNIAQKIALKTKEYNKQLAIGGGVSAYSLPFFKKLPQNSLTKYETRKIIFDAQKSLLSANADKGILKAVGFELMWLRNKREFYGMIFREDDTRLELLEKRYKTLIEQAGGISG